MRVALVDPASFTPPYDHGLASALARRGLEVDLLTSPFAYDDLPAPDGYRRHEVFLPLSSKLTRRFPRSPLRLPLKAVEYGPSVLRFRRRVESLNPDVVHLQWLPRPSVDARWVRRLAGARRTVLTAHDVVPRREGQLDAWLEILRTVDRVVVHSSRAVERLAGLGVPRERLVRIAHPIFDVSAEPLGPAGGQDAPLLRAPATLQGTRRARLRPPSRARPRAGRAARRRRRPLRPGRARARAGGAAGRRRRDRLAPRLRARRADPGSDGGGRRGRAPVPRARLLGRAGHRHRLRAPGDRQRRGLARRDRGRARRRARRPARGAGGRWRRRASACSPTTARSRPPTRAPRAPAPRSRGTRPRAPTRSSTGSSSREGGQVAPRPPRRRAAARRPLAALRRDRDLDPLGDRPARVPRPAAGAPPRAAVRALQVPDDDPGRDRGGEAHGPRRPVRDRPRRPAHHAQRALAPPHEPRRAAPARQRARRPDVARRPPPRPRRAGRQLHRARAAAPRGAARDHGLVAGERARRDRLAGAHRAGHLVRRQLVAPARPADPGHDRGPARPRRADARRGHDEHRARAGARAASCARSTRRSGRR